MVFEIFFSFVDRNKKKHKNKIQKSEFSKPKPEKKENAIRIVKCING